MYTNPIMTDRPGYHRIDNVQEPEDRTGRARTHAWLSVREFDLMFKNNRWKAENLRAAQMVLENPWRIYRHIRDGGDDSGWCFSRKLQKVWTDRGGQAPLREGEVFAVFMNSDMSVFEYGLESADPTDVCSPKGARLMVGSRRGRFGELAWERV